jgi:HEAT repeat protein
VVGLTRNSEHWSGLRELLKAERRDDREAIFRLAVNPGHRTVRIGAVQSLAKRYGNDARSELIALLRSDHEDVRATAACRLYRLRDANAAYALFEHIDGETSDDVLPWCLAAFGLVDERYAVKKAAEVLLTGGANTRARASMVLLSSNLPEAIRALRRARAADMPTLTRRVWRHWKLWRFRGSHPD